MKTNGSKGLIQSKTVGNGSNKLQWTVLTVSSFDSQQCTLECLYLVDL